ncbi:hypothetical protein BOTCAL_0344g00140 [Botryotinia calthae]|uniref:Heterokaryon incompatibility domain-containing protein n=1 Tax=Botryotinia calthae TaxID=38488 RepID=A0A4Y8CTL8_9HELO|nr:hypothetical protein BOTCAL_0344g00140 [Botryotinia calthae]
MVTNIKSLPIWNRLYGILRCDKNKAVIWVDVVCINQNDIPERDAQLQMMADIYKKAEKGLSWLGEKSEDSSLVFRMIQRWASFSVDKQSQSSPRAFLESKLHGEIFMPRSITAVKNLLHRSYWQRVWIQQEVALAPIVTMQSIACSLRCSNVSLPSWVPDWAAGGANFIHFSCTQPGLYPTDFIPGIVHHKEKIAGPVVDISDFIGFSADSKILLATGLLYDEVSVLKGCLSFPPIDRGNKDEGLITFDPSDHPLPNCLTVLEAVFRIFVGLSINITLDSYRRENIPRFNFEVGAFAAMVCAESALLDIFQILIGQDLSRTQEFLMIYSTPTSVQSHADLFKKDLQRSYRMFFKTKNGTLGIGPPGTIPGDKFLHLIGYPDDFVLRKVGDHYRVIGHTRVSRAELPPYSDGGYEIIGIH